MTPPSSADAHSLVARFLEQYGYTSTLDMFRREAGSLIPGNPTLLNSDSLAAHLDSLHLDSPQNMLEAGDLDFYTTLYSNHSNLHTTNILAVSQQPDLIATSGTDKTVKLIQRTHPPTLVRTYQHHQAPVLSIDFHPTQPHLMLTTSMDGTAVLVDTSAASDHPIQRFKDHQRYVVRGLFSPESGQYLATASYDRTLCLYEYQGQKYELIAKRGPYAGNVETIVFTRTGLVAGIQNDHCLHHIPLTGDNDDTKINLNANGDDWVSFSPTWLSLHPAHPDLVLISTDHPSGRLILLDLITGTQIQNYHIAPTADPTDFSTRRHVFHPSGRYFYVIGGDQHHAVKVVETKTGNLEASLDDGHQAMIRDISFDPWATSGCGALLTAGFDHTLVTWSTLAASTTMDDMIR